MENIKKGFYLFMLLRCSVAITKSNQTYISDEDDGYRIAGGENAVPGSHPHMVALVSGNEVKALICGASIIGHYHVLTAGHCTTDITIPGSPFFAIVGSDIWNSGGQEYSFRKYILHPEFELLGLKNDIAMFFTKKPFRFSSHVKPITLSFDWVGAGVSTKVAGWGSMEFGSPLETRLHEVVLDTIEGDRCKVAGAIAAQVFDVPFMRTIEPETEICTYHAAGYGTCQGDSGSALLRADTNQQIGVVSWGFPCALGAPDIFTRISAYSYWIHEGMLS